MQNLCESCESADDSHNPSHTFIKIKNKQQQQDDVERQKREQRIQRFQVPLMEQEQQQHASPVIIPPRPSHTSSATPSTPTPIPAATPVAHYVQEQGSVSAAPNIDLNGSVTANQKFQRIFKFFNFGPLPWPAGIQCCSEFMIPTLHIYLLLTFVDF